MKKNLNYLLVAFISTFLFSSCEDDPEPVLLVPMIDNVEVGLNDNEIAVIGRDFHLDAEVVAGDKIDPITVKIEQLDGETYTAEWSFQLIWEQFKGAKNATVHQHFNIPEEAAEGKYAFTILVTDENGTQLEEKCSVTIYAAENLPVDPQLSSFLIIDQGVNRSAYDYKNGTGDGIINMGKVTIASASVSSVKGDGKMLIVLINKKITIGLSPSMILIIQKPLFGM